MIATTGKTIRAFWELPTEEMKKKMDEIGKQLEDTIKKAVEPCYKDNASGNSNGSGSDSKVSFNADTHSTDTLAQTQPVESYQMVSTQSEIDTVADVSTYLPGCEPKIECVLPYPSRPGDCVKVIPNGCPNSGTSDMTQISLPENIPQDFTPAMNIITS